MASAVNDPGKQGWLVSILELGAWFGVLVTGELSITRLRLIVDRFKPTLLTSCHENTPLFWVSYLLIRPLSNVPEIGAQ